MSLAYYVSTEGKAIITGLSTDTKPPDPVIGMLYVEEDTLRTWRPQGGAWVRSYETSVGSTSPVAPVLHDLWLDTSGGASKLGIWKRWNGTSWVK